jgi:hypothetical protein
VSFDGKPKQDTPLKVRDFIIPVFIVRAYFYFYNAHSKLPTFEQFIIQQCWFKSVDGSMQDRLPQNKYKYYRSSCQQEHG